MVETRKRVSRHALEIWLVDVLLSGFNVLFNGIGAVVP